VGAFIVKVGYLKNIAQENGDFNNVHIWTYGYLLRGISEVAEEYRITVVYDDGAYTSSKRPVHGEGCGKRIKRRLFKCTKLNKVFNADLAGAYNILITPSPDRGVTGWRLSQGINPETGECNPKPSALAGTLALQVGEEVRWGEGHAGFRMQDAPSKAWDSPIHFSGGASSSHPSFRKLHNQLC
jgi:putative transposase